MKLLKVIARWWRRLRQGKPEPVLWASNAPNAPSGYDATPPVWHTIRPIDLDLLRATRDAGGDAGEGA